MTRNRKFRDFALLLIGATAIGNSSVMVRLSETDPAATGFWRMIFALPVFIGWLWIENRQRGSAVWAMSHDSRFLGAAILAGMAFALDLVLSNMALGLTSMTSFIILVHLAPVVVVLTAWLWLREKPTPAIMLALVLAILGAALLVQSGRSSAASANALLGDIAAIGAAVGYAGYILATRSARLSGATGVVSLITALACAVSCGLASWALGESIWPRSQQGWLMLVAMGVICHAFGQGISAYAIGSLGASVTSIVLIYSVAATVFGGWVFFGETPAMLQFAGGALVLSAVIICRPQ